MGIGKIKTENHIKGFKKEISKIKSDDKFFNWFDESGRSKERNFAQGYMDFNFHILMPLARHQKELSHYKTLEIGHGGGRLIEPASRVFEEVHGIDIHNENKRVEKELLYRSCYNFYLHKGNGKEILKYIRILDFDFIYSFVVFQHLEKWEIAFDYLIECYELLKDDGYALIYYGKMLDSSSIIKSNIVADFCTFIGNLHPKGKQESKQKINVTNLRFSQHKFHELCIMIGFEIVEFGDSLKLPSSIKGGQHYVLLKKVKKDEN